MKSAPKIESVNFLRTATSCLTFLPLMLNSKRKVPMNPKSFPPASCRGLSNVLSGKGSGRLSGGNNLLKAFSGMHVREAPVSNSHDALF